MVYWPKIKFLLVVLLSVGLLGCDPPQEKDNDESPTIVGIHWMLANIDDGYWSEPTDARGFIKFNIVASDPQGLEDVAEISITNINGTVYFTVYELGVDDLPNEIDVNTALFECGCWNYLGSTPNQLPLGDYEVTVTDVSGNETRSVFTVNSVEGDVVDGDIYTPEEHPTQTTHFLARPEIKQYDAQATSLDVSLNLHDNRAQSFQLLFVNNSNYIVASTEVFAAQENDFAVNLDVADLLVVNGYSINDMEKVYALSYAVDETVSLLLRPHAGISGLHNRDSFVPPSPDNTAPIAEFSTTSANFIYANSSVTFDASTSSDVEDSLTDLEFRWDWDYDGEYDTAFNNNPIVQHTFATAGYQYVSLQVRDRDGATDSALALINIKAAQANQTPYASFTFSPLQNIQAQSTVTFDASSSSDYEDALADLLFRWDWNGDGDYDTDYLTESTASFEFPNEGTVTVVLEVTDSYGAKDTSSLNMNIKAAPVGTLSQLTFEPQDMVIDAASSKLYLLDRMNARLVEFDVLTGFASRFLSLQQSPATLPQTLTLSADGTTLYIAELHDVFDSSRAEIDEATDIVTINLASLTETDRFTINLDVWDMVVTTTGELYVSGGSRYSTWLQGYRLSNGALINELSVSDDQNLYLRTDETGIYIKENSAQILKRYHIDPVNGLSVAWNDPTVGSNNRPRSQMYMTPAGDYIISGTGLIYKLSNNQADDMVYVGSLDGFSGSIVSLSFNTDNNSFVVLSSMEELSVFNATSFELITQQAYDPYIVFDEQVFATEDSIVLYGNSSGINYINTIDHACANCATAIAPSAALTINNSAGSTTNDYLIFDATASTDGDSTELQYRWDIDGDGSFDNAYASSPTLSHRYVLPGTYNITVRVKDDYGNISEATESITVDHAMIFSGPLISHTTNTLPFVAFDMLLDPTRQRYYVTDRDNGRLFFVDVQTGLATHQFDIGFLPERMFISPDGNKLYVALPIAAHSYYWGASRFGYVAVVDLTADGIEKFIHTEGLDPFSVVATDQNKMLVSDGSNQWTNVKLYDTVTGAELDTVISIRQESIMVLHPDQQRVYLDTLDTSGSIERIDIGLDNTLSNPSLPSQSTGQELFINPDGSKLISSSGAVFQTDANLAQDFVVEGEYSVAGVIESVAFDESENMMFTVNSLDEVGYSNSISLYEAGTIAHGLADPEFVFFTGNEVAVVGVDASALTTSIEYFSHPCVSCAASTAPTISVVPSSTLVSSGESVTFDASASFDAEDGNNDLQICWDWTGNGVCNTAFDSNLVIENSWNTTVAVSKFVTAVLRDSSGLVDSVTVQINVQP